MNIFSSNGLIAWTDEERGHHIWIIETIYRFTVYVEPVNGTIVESVAEVLPLSEEIEGL